MWELDKIKEKEGKEADKLPYDWAGLRYRLGEGLRVLVFLATYGIIAYMGYLVL